MWFWLHMGSAQQKPYIVEAQGAFHVDEMRRSQYKSGLRLALGLMVLAEFPLSRLRSSQP